MKKIIRLTENDLVRLVKRVIREQQTPPTPDDSPSVPTDAMVPNTKGEKIRFYKNEANTTPYEGIYTMTNKTKTSNGAEIIGFYDKPTFGSFDDMKNPLIFDCANNFLKTRPFGFKLYNKNLINDLKQEYCTSGGGGKSVGNIGRYSQIDNKKPSNIA